jgi:glycosyltransferase involved in cell wall biosynthesis
VNEAERLLVVSEFTKSRLITLLGVDEKAIHVIGNGVEDLFFGDALELRERDIQPHLYVIVVGGLTLRKGGDLIISLAEGLLRENSRLRIVVVGRSERWLAKRASRLPNIVQRPCASDTELHRLLSNSLCLFFPSRYEGFGIPVLEAMAAGTPAIILDQAALREVAGDAGVIVSTADAAFEAVRDLHRNPGLRDRYVALGRTRAERFRWQSCVQRLGEALGL